MKYVRLKFVKYVRVAFRLVCLMGGNVFFSDRSTAFWSCLVYLRDWCVGLGVASVCSVDTTRWDGMTDRHAVSSREGQRLQLFLYGILINDLFVGGGPSPLLLSVPAGPGRGSLLLSFPQTNDLLVGGGRNPTMTDRWR